MGLDVSVPWFENFCYLDTVGLFLLSILYSCTSSLPIPRPALDSTQWEPVRPGLEPSVLPSIGPSTLAIELSNYSNVRGLYPMLVSVALACISEYVIQVAILCYGLLRAMKEGLVHRKWPLGRSRLAKWYQLKRWCHNGTAVQSSSAETNGQLFIGHRRNDNEWCNAIAAPCAMATYQHWRSHTRH